jgi:uncharacterized Fe-S cluster-containing radical SAM superfamily protein
MFNTIEFSDKIMEQVCKNDSRKYYRFRKTHFYGGCATADCLGCNLRCAYCWGQKKVWHSEKFGNFHSPKEVSEKLIKMNLPLVRVSGGEPTICKDHLIKLINLIPKNISFILETNGVLLDETFIKELSNFENLYVRVSLKGVDEATFEKITGAQSIFFKNQLNALRLLKKYKIRHGAAILIDLFSEDQIKKLKISNLEYETLIEYPFVMESLRKKGLKLEKIKK